VSVLPAHPPIPSAKPVFPDDVTAAPASSGQERRRRRTQRALQDAAIALVGRRGLADVTVDDIAAAAGVSRRTFFNHFPTKAAALFDPDPSDAERLARLLSAASGSAEPWRALQSALVSFVAGHENVIAVRRRLIDASPELAQYHRTAHAHVEVAIDQWAHAQPGLDDFLATLYAHTAGAIVLGAFMSWRPDDPPELLPELVRRGFDQVASGLCR
jgi:TetR/AcrR family transcriptional regulator, regulator of mycofactocin system